MKHEQIIDFIKVVRNGYPDCAIVYTQGACYAFHQILRQLNSKAKPYMTSSKGHVITKINDRFYDIQGEYINVDGQPISGNTELTQDQEHYWESISATQRVETMINKKE